MSPRPAARPPKAASFRERLGAFCNLPPFLRLVWATAPALAVTSIVLRIVRAFLPVTTLYVGKLIIDEVILLVGLENAPATLGARIDAGLLTRLGWLLAFEFALAIASDVLARFVALLDALLGERLTNETSLRLMAHAATLDLEHFEDSEMQDRLERARRQTMGRSALLGQLLSQGQDIITVVTFGAGLVIYAPWLVLLLAAALVPAFVGEAHFNALGYSLNFRRTPERRELDYIRQVGASLETAKEVKVFALQRFLMERFRRMADLFYDENRRLAMRRAGWGGLLTAVGTFAYYLAYGYIAWSTVTGRFTVGDLTFLAGSFRRLRSLLESLLGRFSQVAGQALYLDDLFSFFDIEPRIRTKDNALPFPERIRDGFVFENVGFRYPGAERWATRHLDFRLHAGETLALVGENGAGKTTIVKLLARLYDPDEGRILLDGHDLRDYDLEGVRSGIGVIFQDFVRYQLTAGENIAVGRIEARDDDERIAAAAARGRAEEVIDRLAAGYDQRVGRRFRDGVDLSGGEWQKIAIARAYMRGAQVLILDEPTAALDARAEYEVFERFKELSEGTTGLLISHRFSSVRMADRILVLGGGRVESAGTHEELMAEGGRYAELFELQAEGYR